MMAKMFYTLDETKSALGKSEDEIKTFAREGRLREFRDGTRLMFKADQVDQLRDELAHGGTPPADIGPSDSGVAIGMSDSAGPSGSGVVSLADTDFGKSPGGGMVKEDTRLAADLGLSGTIGGIPSPGRSAGSGLSGSVSGNKGGGVTVFDVDDTNRVDPSAQTAVGSGIQQQVNLEGVGSGSGLLDLARDRDDTSLGAEILDEITPGTTTRRPAPMVSDSAVDMDAAMEPQSPRSAINRAPLAAPQLIERPDPWAPAFAWLAMFGVLILLFSSFVIVNAIFNVHPAFIADLSGPGAQGKGIAYLLGGVVGAVIFFGIGWFIGKSATPSRR